MPETTIRVAIVDDHPVVREGLRAFLQLAEDIEIVWEAENGDHAVAMAERAQTDIVIMDLVMPGACDGVEAIRRIHGQRPDVRILALTSFQQEQAALDALSAGAIGYLHKDVSPDLLLGGIRQAAAGHMVIEENIWAAAQKAEYARGEATLPMDVASEQSKQTHVESLTQRERQVLAAMAEGHSNKEIGAKLGISEKTVKVHVSHIIAKLNVFDRTQAVLVAVKLGLVDL
ncbi:response regulator [Alicyclobacillus fodiniaquatilis]|uniref:Response regulator n=1 Tax=Alicyclobacillus fodiniaquatilis TaxID=1661150 RepID=A0ABW4JBQ6_9BACL